MGWQDGTPVEKTAQPAWMQGTPVRAKAPIETPAFEKEAAAIANATPAEVIAGYPAVRFAIGASDPIRGAVQLGANAVGLGGMFNENEAQLERLMQAGKTAYGVDGIDGDRLAGNILSPVGLAAAKIAGPATSALQRLRQGGTIGAVTGATTPVPDATSTGDYFGKAGINAALGGGVGVTIPGVLEAGKAGARGLRNILDSILAAGGSVPAAQRVGGRLANEVAGPNAAAVRGALETSQDFVPGSQLTAGQAAVPANSAEFSALQKIAEQSNPSIYAGPAGLDAAQENARRALLREVGQTPQVLDAAKAARAADATQNYGAAYAQTVRADPQLAKMAQNPYFQDAMETAQKLADAKKLDPKKNLTEFLQLVKFGLDKQLGKTGDSALVGEERKVAYAAKKDLVEWMGRKNPAYDAARQEFAAASKPINQMEVGQELEKALASPVQVGDRPGVFANAVNNAGRTIKAATGATGGPRYEKLEDVLTPEQIGKVKMVMQDITRNAEFDKMAAAGGQEASRIAGRRMQGLPQPTVLDKATTMLNYLTRPIDALSRDKILRQLAVDMQNPKEMARLMREATPAQRKALTDIVMRLGTANAANINESMQ